MDMRVRKTTKKRTRVKERARPNQLPYIKELRADARSIPVPDGCIDLVVTSPPYWRKRDYGFPEQIGLERTVEEFITHLVDALREWRRILTPHGSVFLNIGDSYHAGSLASVPGRLEMAA